MRGRLLARVGAWMLRARSRQCAEMSAAELFAHLWKWYRRVDFVLAIARRRSGSYCLPAATSGLREILRAVRERHPNFKPAIEMANPDMIDLVANHSQGAIVVSIHNGISISIMDALQSRGGRCSLLTSKGPADDFDGFLVGKKTFEMIYTDQNVLLKARRDMQDGRVVFCHPDSLVVRPEDKRIQLRIEKGIFEFARRVDARLFYGTTCVSEAGAIVVHISVPEYPAGRRSAADMSADFVAFLRSTLRCPPHWIVS